MDVGAFFSDPSKVGVVSLLLWAVYAFVTEIIVPGKRYRRELKAKDEVCGREVQQVRNENERAEQRALRAEMRAEAAYAELTRQTVVNQKADRLLAQQAVRGVGHKGRRA